MLKFLNNNLDKVAHFSLSNFICWVCFFVILSVLTLFKLSPNMMVTISTLSSCIISFIRGYIKERKDIYFDINDLKANCLGIIFFTIQLTLIIVLFKIITSPPDFSLND